MSFPYTGPGARGREEIRDSRTWIQFVVKWIQHRYIFARDASAGTRRLPRPESAVMAHDNRGAAGTRGQARHATAGAGADGEPHGGRGSGRRRSPRSSGSAGHRSARPSASSRRAASSSCGRTAARSSAGARPARSGRLRGAGRARRPRRRARGARHRPRRARTLLARKHSSGFARPEAGRRGNASPTLVRARHETRGPANDQFHQAIQAAAGNAVLDSPSRTCTGASPAS